MEEMNPKVPWTPVEPQPEAAALVWKSAFPTQKKELLMGLATLVFSLLLCNCLLYAGANLGFAVGVIGVMGCAAVYLHSRGHRSGWYEKTLLAMSVLIAGSFARSDDGIMKLLMVCMLLVVPSLALCLMAGKNRRSPNGFLSLLDAPRTLFGLGFGRMAQSGRGLRAAFRASGAVGKKGGAVALGLLIAIPLLAVMIPLLMFADAAFEGMLDLLPDFKWEQTLTTLIFGVPLAWALYSRTVALNYIPAPEEKRGSGKGLSPLTVNTVLIAVSLLYAAYLFSQLAYFVGGFAGILPEGYTMAQYARRGFFEMAWLCAINLTVISLCVGLVNGRERAPRSTRIICLFLGLVTLFLVSAASAKMFLYIGSYGLTRLRVLTEVFMLWLALTTVFVCIWLFRPKMPYMKLIMVAGLIACVGLMYVDVDAQVARYNVRAYQDGRLETVDVDHLSGLSDGAVPYLYEIAYDSDPEIAREVQTALACWDPGNTDDLRSWNFAAQRAENTLKQFHMEMIVTQLPPERISGKLQLLKNTYTIYSYGEYVAVVTLSEALEVNEQWKDMSDLTEQLQAVLYGPKTPGVQAGPYFWVDGASVIPEIENGVYYFCDRNDRTSDSTDSSQLLSRADKNFTLAVYDQDAGKLYFFMKDV